MAEKWIVQKDNSFFLNTEHTTYAFNVMENCGYLQHLYYGRRIHLQSVDGLEIKREFAPGNSICYSQECGNLSLEDACLEISSLGKGDIREPFVEAVNSDGSFTLDFKFVEAKCVSGKEALKTLPSSYDETHKAEQLYVLLRDEDNKLSLTLVYSVFPECDVITKSAVLCNEGEKSIKLKRLLSNQIDFDNSKFVFTTFNGAWAREMSKNDTPVIAGKLVNSSYTGTSSNRSNPFVMLSKPHTTEEFGECYGFNLIYSGNHYEAVDVNAYGKARFVQGINPANFEFVLESGESFEAPEGVMTFSYKGHAELSKHMHDFVREHIVRGNYKYKVRPVLLNSWEASYFDINTSNLYKLAKAAKDVGIELFVVDDGWFGQRNDDRTSLGDWDVNEKKLPGGLKKLCEKIKGLGLMFGIWVEPEMVNVDSKLYQRHPEWTIDIPGQPHSEGRNQRLLDLGQEEVQSFIIDKMSEVFSSADISYVKWDMNRIFSDVYSKALDKERQGEVFHRYVMGLYHCMDELTKRFPDILFEGCSSGGNRFDLGILCYFPQIWASDNTDAICRAEIQNNYSYGYPQSTITAHVSATPNHQTLRITPLETRFNVSSFGVLGYECNLCEMKKDDLDTIAEQIKIYKKWRELLVYGQIYRGRSFNGESSTYGSVLSDDGNFMEWSCVSSDKTKAVGMILQKLVCPNVQNNYYRAKGLNESAVYQITNRAQQQSIKVMGSLINTVTPIHIKQDSLLHDVAAHFVKLNDPTEEYLMYGDALMYAGLKLKSSFGATGYNEKVRCVTDFTSQMLFMEEKN